jgi:hypothetical protein
MLSVCLFWGCDSNYGETDVARGPDGLGIASVAAVQSSNTITEDGATLTVDSVEPLLVSVTPEPSGDDFGGFLLAPPGDCGSTVDCGWFVLTVRDADDAAILRLSSASSPIVVDLPAENRNEKVTFYLELRDSNGDKVLKKNGDTLSASLSATLTTEVESSVAE